MHIGIAGKVGEVLRSKDRTRRSEKEVQSMRLLRKRRKRRTNTAFRMRAK